MRTETYDRVQSIRSKVLAGKASISDLNAQLADNTDNYVKQLLRQGSNWLDHVEALFLGSLQHERKPPRTLAEESRLLDHAGFFLEKIALPRLKAVQDMVAKFGANIQSIG